MENLKEKTVLVYDEGLFLELAVRLSRDFGRTLYFSPWISEYPKSKDDMVGENVPGIERVSDFWPIIDEIDLFVFPSIYHGGLQLHLESLGKRVWGSRMGDELERFRLQANKHFKSLGLEAPKVVPIIGIDALRKHLKSVEDKFIKVSNYRGNGETWHHDTYELSEPVLDEMEHDLGDEKKIFEWLVEDPISGEDVVEFGYDGYSIDGQFPDKTILGYEKKDAGYICHVNDYAKMSPLITEFNIAIAPTLKKYKYRNFFHTEGRSGKEKVSRIIDVTCREGSPPGELFIEMLGNISEIMWFGAEGIMIQPEFVAQYGIQVMIDSDFARNKWHTIYFPEKIRQWVKLRNFTIIEGTYCIIPRYPDFNNMGAVVAIGDSIKECVEKVKSYAAEIKGYDVDVQIGAIDKLTETIAKGETIGIKF